MGFLSNMFNLKTKYVDEADAPVEMAPKQDMKTFYLDPDSAKTLGKKAKSVEKSDSSDSVLKDTELPQVVPVRSQQEATVDKQVTPAPDTTSSEPSESTSQDVGPTDDGMNMFRNMARNMRRG